MPLKQNSHTLRILPKSNRLPKEIGHREPIRLRHFRVVGRNGVLQHIVEQKLRAEVSVLVAVERMGGILRHQVHHPEGVWSQDGLGT